MKFYRLILCAIAVVAFSNVDSFGQYFSHPLTIPGEGAQSYIARPDVPDTLHTLAIMVQFQPDDDSRTTGNGQFDLSAGDNSILNPPPHDAEYFEYHLEFARRYYKEVSDGRLTIEYTVWDQIFTLSEVMGAYSPRTPGDFTEIGNLFEEAWEVASSEAPEIPFDEFDTFVIFHAGVGRDIDLTSIYGFDPTPLDIPSLYLGPQGLKRIFGEDYEGVETGPDGFRITNSMILPETQNRELDLVTGTQLLQLGMNGLVCAMYGSRLGLPDLFNTDTGRSGIGRFGLMDGQAIFSFFGIFPPELSAWEKYHLGWIEPFTVPPGQNTYELSAVTFRVPGSVLRVPINEREYYLVENRHRNPYGAGQTLTLIQNGEEVFYSVERDKPGFNAFDISDITGVVLDASVYDWSLPGAYIEADNIFYDGGIVIWHIDERIIADRIGENRINADIENRGIRVIEADGSQDIGREYQFPQPGAGSEDGTQFDFWYQGNPAPIYQNRFDAYTIPPSISNTGAPSNVAMYDFSGRNPVMSITVQIGSDAFTLMDNFPVVLNNPGLHSSPSILPDGILIVDDGAMKVISFSGDTISTMDDINGNVTGTPAWYEDDDGIIHLYTRIDSEDVAYWLCERDEQNNCHFSLVEQYSAGEPITAGPVMLRTDQVSHSEGDAVIGTEGGSIYIIHRDIRFEEIRSIGNEPVLHILKPGPWIAVGERTAVTRDQEWEFPRSVHRTVGVRHNMQSMIFAFGDDEIYSLVPESGSIVERIILPYLYDGGWGNPIAHDVNRDGIADLVITKGEYLYAFNTSGAVLDNFPVRIGEDILDQVYPVAADFNTDQTTETLTANNNNLLRFLRDDGNELPGSPIAIGERTVGSPAVFEYDGNVALAVVTGDNLLYAFSFSGTFNSESVQWGEEGGSKYRTQSYEQKFERSPLSDTFLPENRAYNWPNPVYDGVTNIRYYLSEDADVSITIYEINGERVTSFDGPGVGGMDNEIAWDASGIQSGVYLGRIEASNAGRSNVVFIKIAVVR